MTDGEREIAGSRFIDAAPAAPAGLKCPHVRSLGVALKALQAAARQTLRLSL